MRNLKMAALLVCAVAAGCGGGGGGGSDPGLNGWWEFAMHEEGSPDPYDFLFLGPASQAGATVAYLGLDLTFDGTTLTGADPDFADPWRTEYHLTIQGSNLFLGQVHGYRPGDPVVYRDVRLRRVSPPSGTLTVEGTLPADVHSSTAYAIVETLASAGDIAAYAVQIIDASPTTGNMLRLGVELPRFLIFPHESEVPTPCELSLGLGDSAYTATTGAVVFSEFAAP